jgi:hypothetical protein
MAEQKSAEQNDMGKPGVIARVSHAITKDGMLAAAFRQGATELATALRAFPDTIHAEEPGTFLNPTQGEIADSRSQKLPSPSEIAKDKQPHRAEPDRSQEHDHGHGRG